MNVERYPKHGPLYPSCRCRRTKMAIHRGRVSDLPKARSVPTLVCSVCDAPDPDIELGSE